MAMLKNNPSNRIPDVRYPWRIDEKAMLAQSTFPIKPEDLIELCLGVVDRQYGLDSADDLAEDFVFQFPIIGPLNKDKYLAAIRGFQIKHMFPDQAPSAFGFTVDPLQPNRVWFTACFYSFHTGTCPNIKVPTGKLVHMPPQVVSLTFNEKGQVTKFTGGYVVDKTIGNSGGLGGFFGILYAIGKPLPFPEARPWKPSLTLRLFGFVQAAVEMVQALMARRKK